VLGSIVSVPLRSKTIHGIVVDIRQVIDMKSEIKSAPYEIRRAGKVKALAFFPSEFVETSRKMANYYATNVGNIIDSIISSTILENIGKIKLPDQQNVQDQIERRTIRNIFAVQGDSEERISSWKSLIRQEFAKKKSVIFYVPTIEDVKSLIISIGKGIEEYIFELHSDIPKKKLLETWQKISETQHPIVIVATGIFSILPKNDIDTVVIERENGRGWISEKSPYIDLRHVIESISKNNKTIYLADNILSINTLYRLDKKEIQAGSPMKWRSISNAKDIMVDMIRKDVSHDIHTNNEQPTEDSTPLLKNKKNFQVLSHELESIIRINQQESTHLFIYIARRGLSSITVCDDCETIVTCNNCSSPVVLHAGKMTHKNFFMCHKCGEIMNADTFCKVCNGFRLTPLGIGIERVEQEIKDKFTEIEIFKISADSTRTDKEIDENYKQWKDKPGSILLGTDMAISRIREKVDHIAIVSLDSLFALPDFRISEKVMYTITRLRQLAIRTILIQTRKPEEKVFEYGLKGNLIDFTKSILEEREKFTYPPFSVLVKITIEGKKEKIAEKMLEIQKIISPNEIDVFPAFTSTVRGNSTIHGLVKIPSKKWPDMDLITKLKDLPPNMSIRVNPESLL